MSGQKCQLTVNGVTSPPAVGAEAVRVGGALPSSSWEPLDPNARALSEIKSHLAQTLHETVMQTLVGTIYLAESPDTSRRDLVEYLRRATQELRCFIDGLSAIETGS